MKAMRSVPSAQNLRRSVPAQANSDIPRRLAEMLGWKLDASAILEICWKLDASAILEI